MMIFRNLFSGQTLTIPFQRILSTHKKNSETVNINYFDHMKLKYCFLLSKVSNLIFHIKEHQFNTGRPSSPLNAKEYHFSKLIPKIFGISGLENVQFLGSTSTWPEVPALLYAKLVLTYPSSSTAHWSNPNEVNETLKHVGLFKPVSPPLRSIYKITEISSITTEYALTSKRGLEWFFTEFTGAILLKADKFEKGIYTADARDLKNIELKPDSASLDHTIRFKLVNSKHLELLNITYLGQTFYPNCSNSQQIHGIQTDECTYDHAARAALTAAMTQITIKNHLCYAHFISSTALLTQNLLHLNKTHPVRVLLSMCEYGAFQVNEIASISLTTPRGGGAYQIFNLSSKGLEQYWEIAKSNYNMQNVLHFPTFLLNSGMITNSDLSDPDLIGKKIEFSEVHSCLFKWWNIINHFVENFLSLFDFSSDLEVDQWLESLAAHVPGSYNIAVNRNENIVNICTMVLFNSIIHALYSNSQLYNIVGNPFLLSSRFKKGTTLNTRINNKLESIRTQGIVFAASINSTIMNSDWRYILSNVNHSSSSLHEVRTQSIRDICLKFCHDLDLLRADMIAAFRAKRPDLAALTDQELSQMLILSPDQVRCSVAA